MSKIQLPYNYLHVTKQGNNPGQVVHT